MSWGFLIEGPKKGSPSGKIRELFLGVSRDPIGHFSDKKPLPLICSRYKQKFYGLIFYDCVTQNDHSLNATRFIDIRGRSTKFTKMN